MGHRTIETALKVTNESEYKSALKNCTSELKVMKSELDKVTSDFRSNANSMEALTQKGEVLSKMYNTQQQKVDLLRGAMNKAQETRDAEKEKVSDLRVEYEQAQKTLKDYADEFGETSEEYQKQKAHVDDLRDSIIQHQAKLDASTRSYQYYATQLNKAEVELNDLQDRQEENNRMMEEAQQAADGCASSIDRYGDAVEGAADSTGKSTSAVEAMASAMVASGIQQKVEDLASTMMECSEAAQTFEHSVAQVSTISDESVMSTKQMKNGIMELSRELREDSNNVADAVYNALSAGVQTADVLEFTGQSARLAKAGFTDMTTSVDVLTTILNSYKLEADQTEKVSSTLVKTQDLGKVTVDQLGKVLGRVIPSAAAYGVNLDNISAAYANMTSAGINAENTTTYLSTMLDELADSGSNVAEILRQKTGKSFSELMAGGSSLGDVLEILGSSVGYDNTQFSNLWSSATAAKAAVSLFDGSADAFNRTLTKMANSSGTVAKNYEKMTNVSEYSSQRLQVASNNLKIAIGDQLNPVLDNLREAGAGALEVATDFISKHPSVVSAISGLVTALGLLAGGLSALMIAKSVAAAMTALNISLAACPAVLIATAIAGLVAALSIYAAQTETTKDKVDALTESARTLGQTVADGNTSYDDAVVSAEAAASTVDSYIDRLAELESQGVKTSEQQQEYAMLLEKITTLMPGINVELDAQNDLVKGGADALRDQAEAWEQNAIAEAAYTRYKDDISAMADAEYELAKNQALLSVATKDHARISKQYEATQTLLTRNLQKQQEIQNDTTISYEEAAAALVALEDQESKYRYQLGELSGQLEENEHQQSILNDAIDVSNQTIQENEAFVDAAKKAYEDLSTQTEETSGEVTDNIQNMADNVDVSFERLRESYDGLYKSAKDSLDKQVGLFDEISGKSKMSTSDMIGNLKSQITAFDNYATNIQLAMERGIDIGLVQKLSDGSVESMQIIAELVTATDDQIAELNAAFDQSDVAKKNAANTMSAVEAAYSEGFDTINKDWWQKWYSLGVDSANGLIAAYEAKKPAVAIATGGLADTSIKSYKQRSMINSPSKRWMWLAEQEVAAPLQVYKQAVPKMEEKAKELSDAGYLGAIRSKQAAIPSLVSAASSIPSDSGDAKIYQLMMQILAAVKDGKVIRLDSGTFVGATASKYDAAMGQRKVLADRGAI